MFSPHDKIPVCTRDTAGTGHGMPRCVKIQHRTRTHATRDPITAGIPIPVMNPSGVTVLDPSLGYRCTLQCILSTGVMRAKCSPVALRASQTLYMLWLGLERVRWAVLQC
jgi:hypothetical protein